MSGLLKGDLDVGPGDDLQRVRPGPRGEEPGDRQALHSRPTSTSSTSTTRAVGTAMLQDQIFARDTWLKTGDNADIATKFLQASFKGWIYCRDNPQKCVDIVLAKGSQLGASHQAWQMNEINALIWPSPNGIGLLDKALVRPDGHHRDDLQGPQGRPVRRRVPDRPRPEGARRARQRRSTPTAPASRRPRSRSRPAATSVPLSPSSRRAAARSARSIRRGVAFGRRARPGRPGPDRSTARYSQRAYLPGVKKQELLVLTGIQADSSSIHAQPGLVSVR